MRQNIIDLKLLCAGAALGALVCSALVAAPSSSLCGTVALFAVMAGVGLRFIEGRIPHKHSQQQL